MLHEKPDELFHWKNKLDALEQLPHEGRFDKAGAWQKLQLRLEKKPVHQLKRWYWIAAACLLLVAGFNWLNRDTMDHNNTAVKTKQKEENFLVTKPFAVDTSLNNKPMVTENKNQLFITQVKKKADTNSGIDNVQPDTPFLSQVEVLPASPEAASLDPAPDTLLSATTAVVKKKLRVVHINELDRPTQLPDQFASNMGAPSLRQIPHRQDVFQGFEFSRNASDNLLKIKLPPSN